MAKLSDKKASSTQRVILYGAPKTGKTLIAGKLSEHYKMIWVDMENGHETLFQLPQAHQDNIELINLPDTRSYPIAIETVLKMVKSKVEICEEHGKVGCMICKREATKSPELAGSLFTTVDLNSLGNEYIVVFDSLTQLSNSAIANITKNENDDYKLQHDDWGNLGKLLDIFLSHIQQAKYNVIVISHEVEAQSEGTKKSTLVPMGGTRNFSRNVAKYFDHVVYCERKNKKHTFASGTTYATNILAGSRTDISMEALEATSLLPIFKPDVYAKLNTPKAVAATSATTAAAGSTATSSILERLKNKTK
jgi:hypothetical protein